MAESKPKVVITGVGPVTSIGSGIGGLIAGFKSGKPNVVHRELQVDLGRAESLPVASMPPLEATAGVEKHARFAAEQNCPGHRDLIYSLMAMELALADAGLRFDAEQNNIGLIQVFEAPGVEATVGKLFALFTAPPAGMPPPVYELLAPAFYNMQAFLYLHVAAKAFGLRGFCTSVHNACSSAAFAIEVAAQHIRSGQAEVMLVAGGEAFETAVRLEWFRRLDLYARSADAMRPFDAATTGFYVGEGGACLVLESAEHAARRGRQPYAEYLGGVFGHQAWKQTIPDVRGGLLGRLVRQSLEQCHLCPEQVDLIVPHGASTTLSDGYEAAGIRGLKWRAGEGGRSGCVATVFKPYVGHMLACCGLIETIGGLVSMREGVIPGTPNSVPREDPLPVPLLTRPSKQPVELLLKLFTGFTGHDAALLFRKL